MQVVVPFAAESPKTRLEPVLSPAERSSLARAMLVDVVDAVLETGHAPTILSTAPLESDETDRERESTVVEHEESVLGCDSTTVEHDRSVLERESVSVEIDDRSLTPAVDAWLPAAGEEPVAVVMADLALATPGALEALFACDADVAIAPGRGGGTNVLVVAHPEFRVDYHGASYLDHRAIAREAGATLETVDSFRLGTDVDEPGDLAEVLIHSDGRSAALLRAFGFELETEDGRVTVRRTDAAPRE